MLDGKMLKTRFGLSGCEIEIMECLLEGTTNREITENLYINVNTLKHRISNIYGKLKISNKLELLRFLESNWFFVYPGDETESSTMISNFDFTNAELLIDNTNVTYAGSIVCFNICNFINIGVFIINVIISAAVMAAAHRHYHKYNQ